VPGFEAPFMPAVEIGWRFAAHAWGNGYATEAASAVLAHAFDELGLDALVSMTAVQNEPSRRVMERIGMTRDPVDDFDHPSIPEGHPLRRHVLYRIRR
jgi:RimJ/RimL family protein N-acetyltransferase